MLSWDIIIYRQATGGLSPANADSAEGAWLAVWQTGLGGLQWIDELVKEGSAIDLGGNGYPCRYTAPAKHLIPRIVGWPPQAHSTWICGPHDILGPGWKGRTVIDTAVVDACQPDEWLLFVAWDES